MGQAADRLIEDIYDTVTFPERWGGVLERLCASADATHGFLFTAALNQDARTMALWARHNISDALLGDYATHFRHRDLWANAAATQGLLDRCVVRRGEELVAEADLHRSMIFNDMLKREGMGRLCSVSLADGGELTPMQPVLSLFRPADRPPFPEETLRLLQDCAPHLQRAMRLRVRLWARRDGREEETAWSARMIDRLPMGVVLLDAAGRTVAVNRAMQAMIDARDGLRIVQGRLHAEQGGEARRLAHMLEASLSGGGRAAGAAHSLPGLQGAGLQGADLRVSRPSGRAPYLLTVLPLSYEAAGPYGGAGGGDGERIRTAVYIVDPAAVVPGLEARLGALFGLTPVEARLVADLLADMTPAESGDRRGVAISTVRSQLRSIFTKTGTTRQSELMNLVNRCLMLPERPGTGL
ncbi:helix-turn-helix transcriptional regulator [Azospirillum sp. BE72]|uniref:helix-turn-helix transcriptional regulator n=1 Tax=Azospirillum sp. BE72 TaxID=2817776 RepID=UPI00285FF662|nr:helix-turn-helix transcriptional regulator [Azospirillum sp. BE72]MDR6774104.1 DNA-binding CsgD family transcriptional regulator/PAS domain-containing protein [Azospirillum sp. BE72]